MLSAEQRYENRIDKEWNDMVYNAVYPEPYREKVYTLNMFIADPKDNYGFQAEYKQLRESFHQFVCPDHAKDKPCQCGSLIVNNTKIPEQWLTDYIDLKYNIDFSYWENDNGEMFDYEEQMLLEMNGIIPNYQTYIDYGIIEYDKPIKPFEYKPKTEQYCGEGKEIDTKSIIYWLIALSWAVFLYIKYC